MSQSTVGTENSATTTTSNARSFTSASGELLENQHKPSLDFPFASPFGSRANAWGSSSLWAGRQPNGLGSRTATRDSSRSRDIPQQPSAAAFDNIDGKTGSASLMESSVSDENSYGLAWNTKPTGHTGVGRALSQVVPYADLPMQQQQRSLSTAALARPLSGSTQQLPSFVSNTRPPTINLNASSAFHARPSVSSSFSSTLSNRGCEQQPPFTVYTKFDRPTESTHRKPDSAVGTWGDSSTTPSPSDERRPQFASQYGRHGSLPASRDGSLPPPIPANELPLFTRPDYSRPAQQITPASSRAPSISSRNGGAYGAFLTPGADSMASHFGKISLNGDSRPSTSYKSVGGHSSHPSAVSVASSLTRPSLNTPYSDRFRPDYFGDAERPGTGHQKSDSFASNTGVDGLNSYHNSALNDHFSQAYNNFDYRPAQPFANGAFSVRPHDATISRPSPNFHGVPSPRRAHHHADQHTFLDQRFQHHVLATQLRNPYTAALYSPYALQNALQLGATPPPPYMGMLPYALPGMEPTVVPRPDMSVGDGVQSALLFEFKSNPKAKRYELRDIYDHIAEFSGDQFGSRFIQTKLETANSDEKDRVFREIEPNAIPLMTDVFGNYVIQKFFEHGDQRHKKILANKMRGEVLTLSLQMYGCRVVQKALDHVLVDQQASLVSELENHVLRCVKDQNGNHVIQKAIERCSPASIDFIIAAFHGQVQHLSIHPYGCRVIQRCLEKCDLPAKALILAELKDGIPSMISDQFGNYVVQHIVSHDDGEAKQMVLTIVARGLESYSKHKFASNVVETCLERADDYWRREIVMTLAQSNQRRIEADGVLVSLIKDNFGNYVIQKLLDTLHADDYQSFLELLRPAMNLAKRSGCGKQVLSIEKKMHKFHSHHSLNSTPITTTNNNLISNGTYGQHSFQAAIPTPPFASNYNSATTTPPPALTADTQSLQSSGIPSLNGDTVEGAMASRFGHEAPTLNGLHK